MCIENATRTLKGWWPGPVQAAGFLLAGVDLTRWLLLSKPLDESVLTFAGVLIAWRQITRGQERRNDRREDQS